MQGASEEDAGMAQPDEIRSVIRLVGSLGKRTGRRRMPPEQEAFILDRFSTTLEDPRTGKRIRR